MLNIYKLAVHHSRAGQGREEPHRITFNGIKCNLFECTVCENANKSINMKLQ